MPHPETKHGEIWISNGTQEKFDSLLLLTKRRGEVAYRFGGEPFGPEWKLFPIFVSQQEYDSNPKQVTDELMRTARIPNSLKQS